MTCPTQGRRSQSPRGVLAGAQPVDLGPQLEALVASVWRLPTPTFFHFSQIENI